MGFVAANFSLVAKIALLRPHLSRSAAAVPQLSQVRLPSSPIRLNKYPDRNLTRQKGRTNFFFNITKGKKLFERVGGAGGQERHLYLARNVFVKTWVTRRTPLINFSFSPLCPLMKWRPHWEWWEACKHRLHALVASYL